MKRKISIIIISLLVLSSINYFYFSFSDTAKADAFNGDYYGYGDSIMHAGFNENKCFVDYMVQNNDPNYPTNSSDHNLDGNGKTTVWALENFSSHCTDMGNWIIEQFGINDVKNINYISSMDVAQNKLDMYNFSVENGSESHYMPCIYTLADPRNIFGETQWRPWENQCDTINATESLFINYSIRFCPLYDCLDSEPYNGLRDEFHDGGNYNDNVHPDAGGHVIMGDWCWYFVNHEDFTETYHPGNDTITIDADYNETIYVYPRGDWVLDKITIYCTTNDTYINYNLGEDIHGATTIQFNTLKGSFYEIQSSISIEFISINNAGNGTTIYTPLPTINWTSAVNTSEYWLQIDNNLDFSSPEINITNINQYNYPASCDINTTRVSFTLTENLPKYDKYYMRVIPCTKL